MDCARRQHTQLLCPNFRDGYAIQASRAICSCLPHHRPVGFTHLESTARVIKLVFRLAPRIVTNTTNASAPQHANSLQTICSEVYTAVESVAQTIYKQA